MKTGKAVVLNAGCNDAPFEIVDFVDNLDWMYETINCETVDIIHREIGFSKISFSIICDDEGLLKDNQIISAISPRTNEKLVGNLIIVSADTDEDGNLIGLTDAETRYVCESIKPATLQNSLLTTVLPVLLMEI